MLNTVVFWCVALFTLFMAAVTVFSQNIIRSAFAVLGTLIGVAALFGMMGADFLAVVQMMVYVGGIMVLMLFAVMLTHRIKDINASNTSVSPVSGMVISGAMLGLLLLGIWRGLPSDTTLVMTGITPELGQALLGTYAVPFAVASVALVGTLIGAVTIARHRNPALEQSQGSSEEER